MHRPRLFRRFHRLHHRSYNPSPWTAYAFDAIGHCGYEVFPAQADGRPLLGWLTTVTHHDLHHARAQTNFGLYFTWWDRIMGTEDPLYHERFAHAIRKVSRMACDPASDPRQLRKAG